MFYISSLTLDAAGFAQRIRQHWHIENRLHWVKDVVLQEICLPCVMVTPLRISPLSAPWRSISFGTMALTPLPKGYVASPMISRHSFPFHNRSALVYDRGYGNASFVNQTAALEADLLLRLVSNRCVYGRPPAYGGRGAPAKHGHKMKLNAPETWCLPDQIVEVDDSKLGRVRVTRRSAYHFRKSPKRSMEIIRVEILETGAGKRRFQPLWLAWLGQTMPPLETLWLSY